MNCGAQAYCETTLASTCGLPVDRTLAAAAGGWKHKDVVEKHYHIHSPLALAVDIRLELMRVAPLMGWSLE
jgi:hypothetical protein